MVFDLLAGILIQPITCSSYSRIYRYRSLICHNMGKEIKKIIFESLMVWYYIVINFPTNDGSPETTYRNA